MKTILAIVGMGAAAGLMLCAVDWMNQLPPADLMIPTATESGWLACETFVAGLLAFLACGLVAINE